MRKLFFVQQTLLWILLFCFAATSAAVTSAEVASAPDISSQPGEDWGPFLGPEGNGRSGLTDAVVPWPSAGPPVVWHCALGQGYCAPAVARGRAVVFDRTGETMRLRCLEAETGRQIWERFYPADYTDTFGYDGGPRASPVIVEDRVLTFGPEGRLECRAALGRSQPVARRLLKRLSRGEKFLWRGRSTAGGECGWSAVSGCSDRR